MNSYLRFLCVTLSTYFTLLSIFSVSFFHQILNASADNGTPGLPSETSTNMRTEASVNTSESSGSLLSMSGSEILQVSELKIDEYLADAGKLIEKCDEALQPYYKEYFDHMVEWYGKRNIEATYLKGVIQIKTLDFFLLAFGFLFGGYIVIRILIHD